MTVPEVLSLPASSVTSPIDSPGASPNPTCELSEVVSVALAAIPKMPESTGPSLPQKKREFSYEKNDPEIRQPVEASIRSEVTREEGGLTAVSESVEKKGRPICEKPNDKAIVETKDNVAEVLAEEKFVEEKRSEITKGLIAWQVDYKPYPSFWLSFVPGICEIVQKECCATVRSFMEELEGAQTRRKLCSVLEKYRQVLIENECFMNTATAEKAHAACELIDEALRRVKEFGPLAPKAGTSEAKKEKTLRQEDPLYDVKAPLWKKLDDWKNDFVPTPAGLLNFIPGVASKLKDITDRLCRDLFRDIRRAQSTNSLAAKLKIHQELLHAYTVFVDSTSVAKMEAACSLLDEGAKALPSS